ncbi:MAG: hypothetical protein WCP35_14875 [Verrucomicrobiota bacterium]
MLLSGAAASSWLRLVRSSLPAMAGMMGTSVMDSGVSASLVRPGLFDKTVVACPLPRFGFCGNTGVAAASDRLVFCGMIRGSSGSTTVTLAGCS